MAKVELKSLNKSFGNVHVLNDIALKVAPGEFCVFVGPSGCGKSTLLRMIAGLEDATSGDIFIGERRVNHVPSKDRGISMVFQSYALFPHKTVYENIAYGLRIAKRPKSEIDQKVKEASKVLKLDSLLDRKPAHLSGGQRQRVAIGRSIVRDPDVFLFDEPLSNLDAALRVSMRTEIAQLHGRLDATMIYVTHDQVEAMTLADKIVVLNGGIIEQVGTPIELYEKPCSTFVAQFIGSPRMNLLSPEELSDSGCYYTQRAGNLLGVRPEHLEVVEERNALMTVIATHSENLGEFRLGYFQTSLGKELVAKIYADAPLEAGQIVSLGATADRLHLFDSTTGRRV